jgi:hypothetical protein
VAASLSSPGMWVLTVFSFILMAAAFRIEDDSKSSGNQGGGQVVEASPGRAWAKWSNLQTVYITHDAQYELVPGLSVEQLEATLELTERQIDVVEAHLRQAERTADSAGRRAQADRTRVRGSFGSASRLGRELRSTGSNMVASQMEKTVAIWNAELPKLHTLKRRIERELTKRITTSPVPTYSTPTSAFPAEPGRQFCTGCGAPLRPDDTFCGGCGKRAA